ncbi:MAG TPA: hypothetical protein VFS15_24650 [Kofleriaceae bacterium]|nr:hypothetical protein [Kofleriaceae bacterium]
MRSTPMLVLVAAALATPAAAHAQRCRGCQQDTTAHMHIWPAVGVHAGIPQKASAALGVLVGADWQRNGRDHSRNVALFAEPGLAAGRASLAYVEGGYGHFGSGFGVAATVLRTWKDPLTAKPNMSYVGGEVLLWPIVFIGPRVGLFHTVSGTQTNKKWFVALDLGIGL